MFVQLVHVQFCFQSDEYCYVEHAKMTLSAGPGGSVLMFIVMRS